MQGETSSRVERDIRVGEMHQWVELGRRWSCKFARTEKTIEG